MTDISTCGAKPHRSTRSSFKPDRRPPFFRRNSFRRDIVQVLFGDSTESAPELSHTAEELELESIVQWHLCQMDSVRYADHVYDSAKGRVDRSTSAAAGCPVSNPDPNNTIGLLWTTFWDKMVNNSKTKNDIENH